MIITCGKCNSSFRLDDKLIKPGGTKVRCSNCKTVFPVYPQAPERADDVEGFSGGAEEGEGFFPKEASQDPDLSMAVEKIREDELDFFGDELVGDQSRVTVAAKDEEKDKTEGWGAESPGEELDFSEFDFSDLDLELEEESVAEVSETDLEEELDFSDLELELDGSPEEIPETVFEEELDFSDLELELDRDESPEEIPETVFEEELDLSDLELELDRDESLEEIPETVFEEELDLSDLGLDRDESPEEIPETVLVDKPVPDEAKAGVSEVVPEEELDFSDLEGLLDSDEDTGGEDAGEIELELFVDEEEKEAPVSVEEEGELSSGEELDFSDIEEMLGSETVSADSAGDEEPSHMPLGLEEQSQAEPEIDFSLAEDEKETMLEMEQEESVLPPISEMATEDNLDSVAGPDERAEEVNKEKSGARAGVYMAAVLVALLLLLSFAAIYLFKNPISRAMGLNIPSIGFMEDFRNFVGDMGIPYVSEIAKPEIMDPEGKLHLSTRDVDNKFVPNSTSGDLFVITGKVVNNYKMTRNTIALEGNLYSSNKKLVKSKIFYAGNIISDSDLQKLDIKVIDMRLSKRLGNKSVNAKVRPGQLVSFMVVFDNLPEDLTEFTIEPMGSLEGAAIR